MRAEDLVKRDTPARAVIAPKPDDMRRLLLLPGLRFRAVLFSEGKRRINLHHPFRFSPGNSIGKDRVLEELKGLGGKIFMTFLPIAPLTQARLEISRFFTSAALVGGFELANKL